MSHDERYCVRRRALRGCDHRSREPILDARIHQHIQQSHGRDPGNQCDGNTSLRPFDLAGDHVEVVPSVRGPKGGNECGHETGDAALGADVDFAEVAPTSMAATEADDNDAENDHDLQHCEYQLKLAGLLDAEIVEHRNQNRRGYGDELSPGYGEGNGDGVVREKRKNLECAKYAHEAHDHRGD